MLSMYALAAAAQLQTMRLRPQVAPVPPAAPVQNPPAPVDVIHLPPAEPVAEVPPPMERSDLPDLVPGGLRAFNVEQVEVEVRNQGPAGTTMPVRVRACAYVGERYSFDDQHYCSASQSVGALAPGTSRWLKVDCFSRMGDSGCAYVTRFHPVTRLSVTVDPGPDTIQSGGIGTTPEAILPDCTDEWGCIEELNERNNRVEFEAPFPK